MDATASLPGCRMSGGPAPAHLMDLIREVRFSIIREPDVHDLIELTPLPCGERFAYLIRTTFLYPRFAVGTTDSANGYPEVLFQAGSEWGARTFYEHLLAGSQTPEPPA